jgi:hypothetical protein
MAHLVLKATKGGDRNASKDQTPADDARSHRGSRRRRRSNRQRCDLEYNHSAVQRCNHNHSAVEHDQLDRHDVLTYRARYGQQWLTPLPRHVIASSA